ncbi:MAG: mechanosensitive ion channel, partial [Planctomycetales bacterium]|nr:mechanosensitive ion channel [Planctomycetales bacterium]
RLSECLYTSTVYVSGIYLVWSLAMRWSLLNRRAIAIAQARERLAASSSDKAKSEGAISAAIAEQVDLVRVNEQTNRLLTSFAFMAAMFGIYLVWINVLPALERLNQVRLWPVSVTTAVVAEPTASGGAVTSDDSVARNAMTTDLREDGWITLGNLASAVIILIIAWIAVRNIPGLLEIAILQHLPLDASTRFLVTTITRYILIVAGLAAALNTVGFGWSKIQWLAAGVSVGLGFGLQEIFANFIAGLILLFERPLRLGDVITVGDVTGTVVNIRTRATTILDRDHKELIVPNKEFITGRLLNWTLSNTINRLEIMVGVAYGSDIDTVRKILMKVAEEHTAILDHPPTTVTFDLFGDSALNFTLRCFLPDLDERLEVIHELHEQIYSALAEANISIPFPQRDVHLISPT